MACTSRLGLYLSPTEVAIATFVSLAGRTPQARRRGSADPRTRSAARSHRAERSRGSPAIRDGPAGPWCDFERIQIRLDNDDSPDQARTHRLVEDALDLLVPMLPLLDTPIGGAVVQRITLALDRAQIPWATQ
jgi:hypothetical protein